MFGLLTLFAGFLAGVIAIWIMTYNISNICSYLITPKSKREEYFYRGAIQDSKVRAFRSMCECKPFHDPQSGIMHRRWCPKRVPESAEEKEIVYLKAKLNSIMYRKWTILSLISGGFFLGVVTGIGWSEQFLVNVWVKSLFLVAGFGLWIVVLSKMAEENKT